MSQAFTCPHCGGPVAYDPAVDSMNCPYCDSIISVEDYREYLSPRGRLLLNELSCPSCGAQLLTTDVTTATFCSYCGNSVALTSRLVEEDRPDTIIPFKITKKRAEEIYRQKIHRTLLAPDWMEDEESTSHFRGIYMPFHIFRYGWKGSWQGTESETTVRRIKGIDYDVTRTYEIGAEVDVDYRYIPQDASTAFPDAMSESIDNFSYKTIRPFEPGYTAGYYADGSDVDPEDYDPIMARLVSDDINATNTVRYEGMDIPLKDAASAGQIRLTRRKVLLPVWLLTHRVKDRICYAAINGENGDVAADIPLDRGKFIKVSLIAASLISLFMNIFLTIKPEFL